MHEASLYRVFACLLSRDLTLAARRPMEWSVPLMFFSLAMILFPLAVGFEPNTLRTIGSGAVWVVALLASMLSLDSLFRSEFEDGSLDQMLLSPHPLALMVAAKALAHWLVSGLPLSVIAPLLCSIVALEHSESFVLALALLLGTPIFSLIGTFGAALAVGRKRGGMFLSLLVLPLCVPALIFGADAVIAAGEGRSSEAQLSLLGALLLLAIAFMPIATASALRATGSE